MIDSGKYTLSIRNYYRLLLRKFRLRYLIQFIFQGIGAARDEKGQRDEAPGIRNKNYATLHHRQEGKFAERVVFVMFHAVAWEVPVPENMVGASDVKT